MSAQVRRDYLAAMILHELGVKHPTLFAHVGARRALVAWMGAESSWTAPCDGVQGARFNPLNTILDLGGCTDGEYNVTPGVYDYKSALCGAEAVATTLQITQGKDYEPVIAALKQNFVRGIVVLARVAESGWGSFKIPPGQPGAGGPNYTYAEEIFTTYKRGRLAYNAVLVGP